MQRDPLGDLVGTASEDFSAEAWDETLDFHTERCN